MIVEIQSDIREAKDEQGRSRQRLHNLEGLTGTLVYDLKNRRNEEQRRSHRQDVRLQWLIALVALVGIAEPFLVHVTGN